MPGLAAMDGGRLSRFRDVTRRISCIPDVPNPHSGSIRARIASIDGLVAMVDSGMRRGTDVLKALALEARCVFNGRSFNYAAIVAGEAGVAHAIHIPHTLENPILRSV